MTKEYAIARMDEQATDGERTARTSPLTAETRAALAQLGAGGRCLTCRDVATLVRGVRILCKVCGRIESLKRRADRMRPGA
jgi:hypothetical protein